MTVLMLVSFKQKYAETIGLFILVLLHAEYIMQAKP